MKFKPTIKLLYCAPTIWKKIFLFKKSFVFKAGEKFFHNRSSIIPKIYSYCNIFIYSGKRWHTRFVTPWMVGFKFGEFTWNRKLALYKAKQLRKKKNKKK
uniref:Ribosomal protein S19 n=1 Tax=Pseudourostyla cristata TaxID=293816 RepID=A0A4P9JLE3_9SPIT|nr:ribosomal protein S19 [Pseudourostyla cristata]